MIGMGVVSSRVVRFTVFSSSVSCFILRKKLREYPLFLRAEKSFLSAVA